MGRGVTHFEIHALDSKKLQKFYADLFDWKISEFGPMEYGMVDTDSNGVGIGGGIMPSPQNQPLVTVYVDVDDIDAALAKAEQLGASIVLAKHQVPEGPEIGMFSDPDGNIVGVAKMPA